MSSPYYMEQAHAVAPDDVTELPVDITVADATITLGENKTRGVVTLTAGVLHTLANPTTLIEGADYVVGIVIGTGGDGATLALGSNWVATSTSVAFDGVAAGTVNLIRGTCIGGTIYYTNDKKV